MNIIACSEPYTIWMADPVVMQGVWSITKDCAVTWLNLAYHTLLANRKSYPACKIGIKLKTCKHWFCVAYIFKLCRQHTNAKLIHISCPRSNKRSGCLTTLSVQSGLKGCGMGPWLVLVSPCFRENVVSTCKIGSFLCSLDNLLQKKRNCSLF